MTRCFYHSSIKPFVFAALAAFAALPAPGAAGEEGGATLTYRNEALTLKKGRTALWTLTVDPPGEVESFSSASHELSGGVSAWHASLALEGRRTYEAVIVTSPSGADPKMLWAKETTLRGEPAERFGQAVRFTDLSGDGKPELVVGVVSERIRLCGSEPLPLLERRAFDPGSGALRPVLARRDAPPVERDIAPSDPPELEKEGPQLTPATLVSVSSADGGASRSPAAALTDEDTDTFWAPRFRSGAGGELATFAIDARVYPLTSVGLRLPKRTKDRLASVILTTEQGAVRLRLHSESSSEDGWLWFELPEAPSTRCFSLIFEKTASPGEDRTVALADVKAVTGADAPGFETVLAADLDDPDKNAEARRLLEARGRQAAPAVRQNFHSLGPEGRKIAAELLAAIDPEGSLDLLVDYAVEHGRRAPAPVRKAVIAAGPAALATLVPLLESEDPERFGRAVAFIAPIESPAAFDALLALCASDDPRREHLRGGLAAAMAADPARIDRVAELLEGDIEGNPACGLDLVRALSAVPEGKGEAARIASSKLETAQDFAARYHLLKVLQKTGCDSGVPARLAAAADGDTWVREAAVTSLAACFDPDVPEHEAVLEAALGDPSVPVRQAAVESVQGLDDHPGLAQAVAHIALRDPWPHLRAAALEKAAALSPDRFAPLLKRAAQSPYPMLREKAIRIASKLDDPASAEVIVARLEDPDETPKNLELAAYAAADRCLVEATEALFEVLERGAQPTPPPELIFSAVAAAEALGQLGTEEAKERLEDAKRRSNLVTDRAIDAALKRKEPGCAGE